MLGQKDNNSFDFFGVKRKAPSFKYNKPKPTLRKQPMLKTFNFIGNPVSLGPKRVATSNHINWGLPLYRKESIKKKHLSKWGDADMDGSPNYFDCDPFDWTKDAKPIKKGQLKVTKFTPEELKPFEPLWVSDNSSTNSNSILL